MTFRDVIAKNIERYQRRLSVMITTISNYQLARLTNSCDKQRVKLNETYSSLAYILYNILIRRRNHGKWEL